MAEDTNIEGFLGEIIETKNPDEFSEKEVDENFTRLMEGLDRRTLTEVLYQNNHGGILAYAVVGLSNKALTNIRNSISKNKWNELLEDVEMIKTAKIRRRLVYDNKKSILRLIYQMNEMGEIVADFQPKTNYGNQLCLFSRSEMSELYSRNPQTGLSELIKKEEEKFAKDVDLWLKEADLTIK